MIRGRTDGLYFDTPAVGGEEEIEEVRSHLGALERELERFARQVDFQVSRRPGFVGDGAWEETPVPSHGMSLAGVADPGLVTFNSGNLEVRGFDASALEELFFTVVLPHKYKAATGIRPRVHWAPVDGNSGNVRWGLEYQWANIDAAFPSSTSITVDDAAAGAAWTHQVADLAEISLSSSAFGSLLVCRIFRDATADSYGADAVLLGVGFRHIQDSHGSDEEAGEKFVA
jgi:hypothetical protein